MDDHEEETKKRTRFENEGTNTNIIANPIQKKPRMDHNKASPSKVLHVRGLSPDCEEPDLINIASLFGTVVNILLLKSKSQAFIEMDSEYSATLLISYYSSVQANIRFHFFKCF